MEMPSPDNADALGLARENYRLALENNEILKKMEKRYVRGFWLKGVGFFLFFILPLLFIPYLMNSYLNSLGMSPNSMDSLFGGEANSNAQQILDLLQNQPSNPR